MLNSIFILLQKVQLPDTSASAIDSARHTAKALVTDMTTTQGLDKLSMVATQLVNWCVSVGMRILAAVIIFIIGRFLIRMVNKLVKRILNARGIDPSVKSFLESLINILLLVLLLVAVINKLGIETTSFAALLASFGVAVGMALSGNLQNIAGGILILLFRPYKVGDYVKAQDEEGTVEAIQIFHTVIRTYQGNQVFMPNGLMSSNKVINFTLTPNRMVEWNIGVEYGADLDKVEKTLRKVLAADGRIHKSPEPYIALKSLADSSVVVTVRVWVASADYADVLYRGNQRIYEEFNKEGIDFPFPQMTIHNAKD